MRLCTIPEPNPVTARGPVTDAEELGKVLHEAAQDAFAASMDGERTDFGTIRVKRFPWERVRLDVQRRMVAEAAAVRDAVVPPKTHIVVPRAEHDRLLRLIPDLLSACETSGDEFAVDGFVRGTIDDIAAAHDAYRAALGEGEVDADA